MQTAVLAGLCLRTDGAVCSQVYHDQLGMAIPGGYAVGAAGQVPFEEPETAAVSFGLERQDMPAVLTFFCESCCLASPGLSL